MNRILIVCIILLSTINSVLAQDISDRKLEAQYKAERLTKILQMESQKTANQDFYDVKHYDLDLTIDVQGKQILGTVTILSEVVGQAISQMDVNLLSGMTVDGVKLKNTNVTFQHRDDIITIALDKTYQPGELIKVSITYHGRPEQSGFGAFGFDTHNGQPMIWSLSEPFGARNWWPCKDFPSDKADSADIRVTVPKNLIVASNGNLRSEIEQGNLKTYWWHESYPIVTYLVSVAIHPFFVYSDYYHYSATDSMEVRFYVYPDQVDLVRSPYAKVVDMIKIFADIYGEYPFIREKYGHAQFEGGANMEHQTLSSMVSRNETTIAHELAHQWWGDYITCENFHEIWLNEGFATYSEALYLERYYGRDAFWQEVASNKYFGGGTIYVSDLSSTSSIFNYNRTYRKASWILHMLRHVVGDENFFKILKDYYNDSHLSYGTATTDDFQAICERVSGIDLEKYFYQWLHEEYFPTYSYAWSATQNGANYDIQLQIEQLQQNHTFWMPIDVTVTTASGETTFVVWDSLATQTFNLTAASEPFRIELDKYNWILKQVQEPLINPTFSEGILLVNGVSWDTYGTEIRNAYQNKAFWGNYPISFWDCFPTPMGGDPSTLPSPLGHGKVPADILGKFSTIIWIGNNYDGDIASWTETSILQYLKSGGNVLLMTRMGQDFVNSDLQTYLGIAWAEKAENQI
ncbi:M1 family metallopeptidase, partial [candidate division KSB1 bacterium]|nr:M1 family metallopeptidase [candidate division KSB1 bacterium]